MASPPKQILRGEAVWCAMSETPQTANDRGTSVAPMLSVRNGASAVKFYKAAFGAQVLFRHDDPKAGVVARTSLGKSDFWLANESRKYFNFSPETRGGGTRRMVVIVEDPDAVSEQAFAAGAKVVWPVSNQSYGWRLGRIVDPFGLHREIGKPLTDD